jgi:hypothetical protein
MDADQFDRVIRGLAEGFPRRRIGRILAAIATANGIGWSGSDEAEAGRRGTRHRRRRRKQQRRRRRRNRVLCSGRNWCTTGSFADTCHDTGFECQCRVTVGSGKPSCAQNAVPVADCSACQSGQTCVVSNGMFCEQPVECATPCEHPK